MAQGISGAPTTLCDIEAGWFRGLATGKAEIGAEQGRPGAGAHSRHLKVIFDIVVEEVLGCACHEQLVHPRV